MKRLAVPAVDRRLSCNLGPRRRASDEEARHVKAMVGCNIVNTMLGLGRPESYSIVAEALPS